MGRMLIILIMLFMVIASFAFMSMHNSNQRNTEIVADKAEILECRITAKEVVDSLVRRYLASGDKDFEESFFASKGKEVQGNVKLLANYNGKDSVKITAIDSTFGEENEVQLEAIVVASLNSNEGTGDSPFKKMAEELEAEDPDLYPDYFIDQNQVSKKEKQKWNAISTGVSWLKSGMQSWLNGKNAGDDFIIMRNNAQSDPNIDFQDRFYEWCTDKIKVSYHSQPQRNSFVTEELMRFVMPWDVLDSLSQEGVIDPFNQMTSQDFNDGKWQTFIDVVMTDLNLLASASGFKGSSHQNEAMDPDAADSIAKSIFWPRYHSSGGSSGNNNDRDIKKINWTTLTAPTTNNN